MKFYLPFAAALACLLATPALAENDATVVLEKSSDWVLDYAEERCSLIRTFGDGDNLVRLQIDSFGAPYGLRATIHGGIIPSASSPMGEIGLRLTPDTETRVLPAILGTVGEASAITFALDFAPAMDPKAIQRMDQMERFALGRANLTLRPDFENRTNSMMLEMDRGRRKLELRTGRMAAPLQALRDCVTNLQQSWGLDPQREERLQRPALIREATVRKMQERYPYDMVREGQSAYVPVRVMVDAAGKPTQCVPQTSGPPKDFLDAVCEGLHRDFDPALDENGQPVASIFRTSVLYTFR